MNVNKKWLGSPYKYETKYRDLLIEHMTKGYSYESFPKTVMDRYGEKIGRTSLYNWERCVPEWEEAKQIAVACRRYFYEKIGIAGMTGQIKDYNVATWIVEMMNSFGYKNKQTVEHEGQPQQVTYQISMSEGAFESERPKLIKQDDNNNTIDVESEGAEESTTRV